MLSPEDGASSGDVRYLSETDQIIDVVEHTFDATYTGDPFPGFEGPNAFDISKDKMEFPDGEGPLFESQPDQKSTKAATGKSIVITVM